MWKIWRFGKIKNVRRQGGQHSQLPSHVQGHLTNDHVELTHARMHDCQEKALPVSHEPLVLLSKLISVFFPFSFPGYNAQPTENKYNSIAKGIPRTRLQSL